MNKPPEFRGARMTRIARNTGTDRSREVPMKWWLSYGGGVNSTALAILLVRGELPQYQPFGIVMADTGDERPETYAFIAMHFQPWLERRGATIEIAAPPETVLQRWQRMKVTGSRMIRSCTEHAKIKPIRAHINGQSLGELVGIDAGEDHRAPDAIRPLVDLGIDRDGCVEIIRSEGLPVPVRSGCWHCPFMSTREIVALAADNEKASIIERLEANAAAAHDFHLGHFKEKPMAYWKRRASQGNLDLSGEDDKSIPCYCTT